MKKCPFCAEEIQDEAIKCRHCGSMLDQDAIAGPRGPRDEFEDVRDLARRGEKIAAIKLLRDKTRWDLKKAKDFVEGIDGVSATQTAAVEKPLQKVNPAAVGCLALIAFAIVAVIVSSMRPETPKSPEEIAREQESTAFFMCRRFVTERLRSPKTAEFPSSDQARVTKQTDGDYVVVAYVDSQNGFGALIRSTFSCTVKPLPDGENWRLVDVNIK